MYAICNLSIVPVRKEASDRSEMVTQLLFGETVQILDKQDSWRKVKIYHDDYTGWVDKKQLGPLQDEEYNRINKLPSSMSTDIVQLVVWDSHHVLPVVLGASLPGYDQKKFRISTTEFSYDGNVITRSSPDFSNLNQFAFMYLNAPYLWGGRTPFGLDCSGFTQMVFKLCGFRLNRDAEQQATQGKLINLIAEARPGDLAFFENPDGKIVHTGIILADQRIIHASGRVRVDKIDHQGIFNEDTRQYTHALRLIRRLY